MENKMNRPFLWLFTLLWFSTYILFPSWMLPGYQYYSIIALGILIIFFSVNIWFFYHWGFDHEISWQFSFDVKRIAYIYKEHRTLVIGLFVYMILQLFPLLVAPIGLGDPIGLALAGPHILSPLWSFASYLGVPLLYVRLIIIGLMISLIWYATRKPSILYFNIEAIIAIFAK